MSLPNFDMEGISLVTGIGKFKVLYNEAIGGRELVQKIPSVRVTMSMRISVCVPSGGCLCARIVVGTNYWVLGAITK